MDKPTFEALKKERRRLQGSVNYWTLQVKNWQANVTKHAGNERRQTNAQHQLDYASSRLAEATQQHTQISAQLTALDPQASQQRQLHSLHNMLGRARTELARTQKLAAEQTDPEGQAFWQSKIEKLSDTVAKYIQRTTNMRSAIASDRNQQLDLAKAKAEKEHLAVINEVYTSTTASEIEELKTEYAKTYGPYPSKNGPTTQ